MTSPTPWPEWVDEKLDKWLETTEHKYDCTAYSEGQFCCLDKEKHRNIVKNIISTVEQEAVEKYSQELIERVKGISYLDFDNDGKPLKEKILLLQDVLILLNQNIKGININQ